MKHNYKEGIVYLTFINKKGMKKTVKFPMRKSYYDDICKLPESEQFKWLLENYKYYNAEKYQEKKHTQYRDKFISPDFNYDDDEEISNVTKKKIIALAYDPKYEETLIIEETVNIILSDLSPVEKVIIVECVMNSRSVLSVSKELGLNESSVRRKKDKLLEELKEKYRNLIF